MGQVEVEWTYRKQGGEALKEADELAPVQEDFFQHIYNVNWDAKIIGFLFIGAGGVFTSKDAKDWGKISKGFSANAVAYGKKVWVAATDGGVKLSKDNGKTWKSVGGPKCQELVFAGPKLEGSKEKEGAFYALKTDVEQGSGEVWSSSDGLSWEKVYTFTDFIDGPGILGYDPENLGTGHDKVVVTATQWVEVPTDDTQAGQYTRAAKLTGSNGSLSGPFVYGPDGNANFGNFQSSNTGAGATWDQSTGREYTSYLKTDGTGFGSQSSSIYVNGAAVATSSLSTSSGGGSSGTDINGGTFMGAAGGQCWFLAREDTFSGTNITTDYYMISAHGTRFHLAGPIGTGDKVFAGNTCGLSIKDHGPAFCTVFSAGGKGGLWTIGESGGWINTFQTTGGAVGVGKIKKPSTSP